jgi:hypothetical protein
MPRADDHVSGGAGFEAAADDDQIVIVVVAVDMMPTPMSLIAATAKVYRFPLVRPLTFPLRTLAG